MAFGKTAERIRDLDLGHGVRARYLLLFSPECVRLWLLGPPSPGARDATLAALSWIPGRGFVDPYDAEIPDVAAWLLSPDAGAGRLPVPEAAVRAFLPAYGSPYAVFLLLSVMDS